MKKQQAGQAGFQSRKATCLSKRDKSSAGKYNFFFWYPFPYFVVHNLIPCFCIYLSYTLPGRIDPKAVDICAAINAREEYYTTSSCAGRCFLYIGDGIKAHHHFVSSSATTTTTTATEKYEVDSNDDNNNNSNIAEEVEEDRKNNLNKDDEDDDDEPKQPKGLGFFHRFRVNHDIIRDPQRYFNLHTLNSTKHDFDPSGGGDPVRSIGQYDYKESHSSSISSSTTTTDNNEKNHHHVQNDDHNDKQLDDDHDDDHDDDEVRTYQIHNSNHQIITTRKLVGTENLTGPIWLRFEPFILHVMCRSLSAASALMTAARPAFKNVGLTSFKHGYGRYIVAIWGDEGIDMPLTPKDNILDFTFVGQEHWLSELVNERHYRNWQKIDRFVNAVRSMPEEVDNVTSSEWVNDQDMNLQQISDDNKTEEENVVTPKRFDVVGDVALLHALPESCNTEEEREAIGKAIMKRNKAIKVVAVRSTSLSGTERAPGMDGLSIIAGTKRSPLITSHCEYGIKCVIDLNRTFFTARMAAERLRICQQVARGEKVLALFCGVGMDAMQIAARTEATVLAVEYNPVAVACAERGKQLLVRNKAVKCAGASDRLTFVQGDAIEIMKQLEPASFDRILAPRPKEGDMDGDLGNGDGGVQFLEVLLPLLKDQGECHWYDFAADHELPHCERTKNTILKVCSQLGLQMEVIHVAKVGSIAKRQLRVCMDFRIVR